MHSSAHGLRASPSLTLDGCLCSGDGFSDVLARYGFVLSCWCLLTCCAEMASLRVPFSGCHVAHYLSTAHTGGFAALPCGLGCVHFPLCLCLHPCLQRRWFLSWPGRVCFVELHCVVPEFLESVVQGPKSTKCSVSHSGFDQGPCPQGHGPHNSLQAFICMERHTRATTVSEPPSQPPPPSLPSPPPTGWSGRSPLQSETKGH